MEINSIDLLFLFNKTMEQEQILSTLKEKVGQTSLDDRTFSEYISLNMPEDGVEPDESYWNKHAAVMKSLNGNFSHRVAEEVNEFKKNYKPNADPDPKPDDKSAELIKRLETLESKLENDKLAQRQNILRSELKSKAEGLKVANKAIWNDISSSIDISESDTTDSLFEKVKKAYENKLKEYMGDGAVPYGGDPKQGSQKMTSEEMIARREEFKKKKQAQGRLPKE